jgi:hypothetical protein
MNQELIRINAMRRIALAYFDQYVENNVNPTMEGFMEYVAVEEEMESSDLADERQETESAVIRSFVNV